MNEINVKWEDIKDNETFISNDNSSVRQIFTKNMFNFKNINFISNKIENSCVKHVSPNNGMDYTYYKYYFYFYIDNIKIQIYYVDHNVETETELKYHLNNLIKYWINVNHIPSVYDHVRGPR